jgi:hypothetical protein
MNPLNAYLALELMNDYEARAARHRRLRAARERARPAGPTYDAVTIRRTTPDDWHALERLAQLEGRSAPVSTALVAEVDDCILAAHWIREDLTLADPFHPTGELVSLLVTRARHLGAHPRLIRHPLRRAAGLLRRTA